MFFISILVRLCNLNSFLIALAEKISFVCAQVMRQIYIYSSGMLNCDCSSDIQTWPGVFLTHHVLLGSDYTPLSSSTHGKAAEGSKSGLAVTPSADQSEKSCSEVMGVATISILTHWEKRCVIAEERKKEMFDLNQRDKKKHFSERLLLLWSFWRWWSFDWRNLPWHFPKLNFKFLLFLNLHLQTVSSIMADRRKEANPNGSFVISSHGPVRLK